MRCGVWLALLLPLVVLAGVSVALANAPVRSIFPEPRPDVPGLPTDAQAHAIERALAAALPEPAAPSGAASPARFAEAAEQAVVAALPEATASVLAPARSLLPTPRPAGAARRPPPTIVVLPARAGDRGGSARGGGGLCDRPTLSGSRISPIGSSTRGCGIAAPVRLTAVDGIALSRMATLDCDAARALDRWVREQMRPAMGGRGGGVVQIDVAAHYVCRTRNHRAGARISEHGRGRAIDISGFRLANGEQVTVLGDFRRGPHARALQRMHRGACGIFTTTLGPGSDGFHEDHFHFDVAQRRGNATYCR